MSELAAVAFLAFAIVGLVTAGYGIGAACSWWDRKRQVKQYHEQRKG